MTWMTRSLAIVVLVYLIGACTRVGHIQRNEPVRSMTYPGSHLAAAQCVLARLGGKTQNEGFDRLVVYNSVKGRRAQGISHYAVTFGKAGEKGGFAEMRIASSDPSLAPGPAANALPYTASGPSASVIDEYWNTVQNCAAQAKPER